MTHTHAKKVTRLKSQSGNRRTDGKTDEGNCITSRANAVGSKYIYIYLQTQRKIFDLSRVRPTHRHRKERQAETVCKRTMFNCIGHGPLYARIQSSVHMKTA